jgi:hypothetical protein
MVKTMQSSQTSSQMTLETLLKQILAMRRITRSDQQLLMTAFMQKGNLSESDRQQISAVFDALKRGLVKVVD